MRDDPHGLRRAERDDRVEPATARVPTDDVCGPTDVAADWSELAAGDGRRGARHRVPRRRGRSQRAGDTVAAAEQIVRRADVGGGRVVKRSRQATGGSVTRLRPRREWHSSRRRSQRGQRAASRRFRSTTRGAPAASCNGSLSVPTRVARTVRTRSTGRRTRATDAAVVAGGRAWPGFLSVAATTPTRPIEISTPAVAARARTNRGIRVSRLRLLPGPSATRQRQEVVS